MTEKIFYKTVGILEASIEISTNREEFLPVLPFPVEVKSLLTDFHRVLELESRKTPDGRIKVLEEDRPPSFSSLEDVLILTGPFSRLEDEASDLRFSLWGNQGFLYRYALSLLEDAHDTFSFHACALFDEKTGHLCVFTGGAGSGKTVYLLSGLIKGLKLFSTETVHFRVDDDGGITWFMGSLLDNVRFGTLSYDFPSFMPDIPSPPASRIWEKKVAIDLSEFKVNTPILKDVEVSIVLPRIEAGRKGFHRLPITSKEKSKRLFFDNITEKIAETFVLYDRFPVPGFDDGSKALKRLRKLEHLIDHPNLKSISSVLSNPKDCWGNILNQP